MISGSREAFGLMVPPLFHGINFLHRFLIFQVISWKKSCLFLKYETRTGIYLKKSAIGMLPCSTPSIRPCPTQTPFLSHNQNRQCLCNFNKFNLLYDYLSTSLTVGSSEYGDSNSKFNYNSDSNSSQRVKKRFS